MNDETISATTNAEDTSAVASSRETLYTALHSAYSNKPIVRRPTFTIACWAIGLIAFAQLITLGTAINVKLAAGNLNSTEVTRSATNLEPIQPRTLAEILAGSSNSDNNSYTDTDVTPNNPAPTQSSQAINYQDPRVSNLPTIANPRVARLVQESKTYQIDGDVMNAILKLEEAQSIDPGEPAIMYEKAVIFEDRSLFVKAADEYQKIQQMGTKAGVYFKLATRKLTESMDTKMARRNVISIGPASPIRKSVSESGIKETSFNISLRARPDTPINPDDVTVNIHFYDRITGAGEGEIKKCAPGSIIEKSWADNQQDWRDTGNEEFIQVTYLIPKPDASYAHLFGERNYYGYVIELVYKGEVIDQKAEPRRLHAIHGGQGSPLSPNDYNSWGADDGMLLPSLESTSDESFMLPLLPFR